MVNCVSEIEGHKSTYLLHENEKVKLVAFVGPPDRNLCYFLLDKEANSALVIDPGISDCLIDFVQETQTPISAIILTHGHQDHSQNAGMLAERWQTDVLLHPTDVDWLPTGDSTKDISEGDTIRLGNNVVLEVWHTPGHTSGSVCFNWEQEAILFTGDTLFMGSCGYCPDEVSHDLFTSLLRLRDECASHIRLLPGHECGLERLNFNQDFEPTNDALIKGLEVVRACREKNDIPIATAEDEQNWNVFWRLSSQELIASLQRTYPDLERDEWSVFAKIFDEKNKVF